MGALIKTIFALGGGPAAWFSTAVGWLYDGLAWCAKHWKIVLSVLALVWAFTWGASYGKRVTSERLAAQVAAVQAEHDKVVKELDGLRADIARVNKEHADAVKDVVAEAAAIDKKAKADAATRQVAYNKIKKELDDYVAKHSGPAAAGSCRDTDIGDDGVRLIESARAARVPGAGAGH